MSATGIVFLCYNPIQSSNQSSCNKHFIPTSFIASVFADTHRPISRILASSSQSEIYHEKTTEIRNSEKPWISTPYYLSTEQRMNSSLFKQEEKNSIARVSEETSSQKKPIKMPTAPWMTDSPLLPHEEVLDFSVPRKKTKVSEDRVENHLLLMKDIRGVRGKKAMNQIVESITKLAKSDPLRNYEGEKKSEFIEFTIPLESLKGDEIEKKLNRRAPWERIERINFRREKKEKRATVAEQILPEDLLFRLRGAATKITRWVKVKKAGLNQLALDEIKMIWKSNELAMVKFDEPLCRCMDRAMEILEAKTGGLVIWRKNNYLVVYRGCNYQPSTRDSLHMYSDLSWSSHDRCENQSLTGFVSEEKEINKSISSLYEREVNRLLDDLGPRFIDWWWRTPLPVDADLLPEVVPNFRTPLRLCSPLVSPKLSDSELTYLRKLARPLPTHFALGKHSRLHGLAAAIIKLWEKSIIAKIALKYGIPNLNNEKMALELKRLTGGTLVLRNKFFIILYRGKDFMPTGVANLIAERERELESWQIQEENLREKAINKHYCVLDEKLTTNYVTMSGTFSEFLDIEEKSEFSEDVNWKTRIKIEAEKHRLERELRKQESRLLIFKLKIERSEKELAKLDFSGRFGEELADKEMLTEEERENFKKIGLKMDETLLLGRRGVYDGVIGSIHQHWKHREVVKVITMQKKFSQIIDTAMLLELESGGTLIAVEKLKKGHAIIIYRGKNYKRPLTLLPENLLSKREALNRSILLQRRGSLKFFASQAQRTISRLNIRLKYLRKKYQEATFKDLQG